LLYSVPHQLLFNFILFFVVGRLSRLCPSNAPEWAIAASDRIRKRMSKDGCVYNDNSPPEGISKILLHSCCAPCSGTMVEEMLSYTEKYGLEVVIFFYNPNIHPKREYTIRKEENK